jgi:paraquat-inducible protein B
VNIGTVTDIQLVVGEEDTDIRIPVIIEIDNTKFISSQTGKPRMDEDNSIDDLVRAGMRAQLQLQSLLTGQLFIQIDFYPGTEARLVSSGKRSVTYEEIPTIPTPIERIGKLLEGMPLDQVMEHIISAIEGIDRLVSTGDLQQSIAALRATLDDFRALVNNLDRHVDPLASRVNLTLDDVRNTLQKAAGTLDDVRGTLQRTDTTLQSADNLLNDEQLLTALDGALNGITSAAYAIRILAETINNQPESLLKGRR